MTLWILCYSIGWTQTCNFRSIVEFDLMLSILPLLSIGWNFNSCISSTTCLWSNASILTVWYLSHISRCINYIICTWVNKPALKSNISISSIIPFKLIKLHALQKHSSSTCIWSRLRWDIFNNEFLVVLECVLQIPVMQCSVIYELLTISRDWDNNLVRDIRSRC